MKIQQPRVKKAEELEKSISLFIKGVLKLP